MARAKTESYWRDRVAFRVAEGDTAADIFRLFEREAKQGGRNDYPAAKTIRSIAAELSKDEEKQNALFRWPRAMEIDALPWEASCAALDLLAIRDRRGLGRPTVRQAKWYWRLFAAAPDLSPEDAEKWSAIYAASELAAQARLPAHADEAIEWRLAYRPWSSDEARASWSKAVSRKDSPIDANAGLTVGAGTNPDILRYLLDGWFGSAGSEEMLEFIKRRFGDRSESMVVMGVLSGEASE